MFDELFFYAIGGFALVIAITLGLGAYLIYKAFHTPSARQH